MFNVFRYRILHSQTLDSLSRGLLRRGFLCRLLGGDGEKRLFRSEQSPWILTILNNNSQPCTLYVEETESARVRWRKIAGLSAIAWARESICEYCTSRKMLKFAFVIGIVDIAESSLLSLNWASPDRRGASLLVDGALNWASFVRLGAVLLVD